MLRKRDLPICAPLPGISFDIDKLKGFSSSSYNDESIIYWALIYYFFCVGLIHIYKNNIKKIDIEKLKKNF